MECLQTQSELADMNQGVSCHEDSKTPLGFASRWFVGATRTENVSVVSQLYYMEELQRGEKIMSQEMIKSVTPLESKENSQNIFFPKRWSMKKKLFVFLQSSYPWEEDARLFYMLAAFQKQEQRDGEELGRNTGVKIWLPVMDDWEGRVRALGQCGSKETIQRRQT